MTDLVRPELVSKTPLRIWMAAALTGAITGGLLAASLLPTSQPAPTIVATPTVSLVPVPPTLILMKTDAPAPPAPQVVVGTPPAPPPPPVVRAATPWLDADCLLRTSDDALEACDRWDAGFPAIARDGSTVAVLHSDDDGGRGYPNYRVELIDVATSKVARTVMLLDADEYDPDAPGKLAGKVARRTKAAQKLLDAGGYRSMTLVPVVDRARYVEDNDEPLVLPTTRYAEVEDDLIRMVDPATARSAWHANIGTKSPFKAATEECGAWFRLDAALAIDEATGVALVTQMMRTGGCMCPDLEMRVVKRIPGGS